MLARNAGDGGIFLRVAIARDGIGAVPSAKTSSTAMIFAFGLPLVQELDTIRGNALGFFDVMTHKPDETS